MTAYGIFDPPTAETPDQSRPIFSMISNSQSSNAERKVPAARLEFTPEDNELLIDLKEEKKLSCEQIAELYPG
jgi:hypothetical protein